MDNDCLFCKIANGYLPSHKVYEDDICIAFLDVNPTSKGHTLVLPKKHNLNYLKYEKNILNHVLDVAQAVGQNMITNLGASGINIISNVGKDAGQSVMHFHVHVIPRYSSDGLNLSFKPKQITDGELLKICDSLKK